MAQSFEFCDERAKEAAIEAAAATLDNVRDRAVRSEKAWRAMADQALKLAQDREQSAADRAARDLAAAAEKEAVQVEEAEVAGEQEVVAAE